MELLFDFNEAKLSDLNFDDGFVLTFLSLGFCLAFSNSSSRYVRVPILQSITHGESNSHNKSCIWIYSEHKCQGIQMTCVYIYS